MSTLSKVSIFVIMLGAIFLLGYQKGHYGCVISAEKTDKADLRIESKIDEKIAPLTDAAVDKRLRVWTRQ